MSWLYPGHPSSEVELRLSAEGDGTVLELEHAIPVDQFPTEAKGVGPGWDPALLALDLYLRGELPEAVASRWRQGELPPEIVALIEQSGRAWAELVDRADGR